MDENIECGGFIFIKNFDSANLAKVERVEKHDIGNFILIYVYTI